MRTRQTGRFGFCGAAMLLAGTLVWLGQGVTAQVSIDDDDIGGVVRGGSGPEAGVWVIAETDDLGTLFRKIVVTDDAGRYVLPDLPDARYRVWVRGYGLTDSEPVPGRPGTSLDLRAVPAANPREAAQVFPANYWYSLVEVPDESEFPGTRTGGQRDLARHAEPGGWIDGMKQGCQLCHQLGNQATRGGAEPRRLRLDRGGLGASRHDRPARGDDGRRVATFWGRPRGRDVRQLDRPDHGWRDPPDPAAPAGTRARRRPDPVGMGWPDGVYPRRGRQ